MRHFRIMGLMSVLLLSLMWSTIALATTITVDGNPTDWPGNPGCVILAPGCALIANDVNEPGVPDSFDIQTVWATNNSTTAFFRYDTYAPTLYSAGEFVRICLAIPGEAGNDSVGGCTGLPTDRLIVITDFGSGVEARVFNCNVVACNNPFAAPLATVPVATLGAVNELAVPLSNLGITAAHNGNNISVIIYADNNDLPPDDNIPDSGIVPWPVGNPSPTAVTLASLSAQSSTLVSTSSLVAGLGAIPVVAAIYYLAQRRRRRLS